MIISATDITRLLYEAGRFTPKDTAMTAMAIQAYSYGLLGYGLLKVLNSYYYATGRTRFPMMVSLLSIAGNYFANSLLVKQIGHEGLALTASITLTMNALLLIFGMSKDSVHVDWRQVLTSLGLLIAGSIIVWTIHGLYAESLASWSPVGMLGIPQSVFQNKCDAAIRIAIDGSLVIALFGSAGLARIKKTPKEAWRMLKRRR
jgi:peptidoglycan biosynthesis protein MviN/MurJ (putative lipid II flippase)